MTWNPGTTKPGKPGLYERDYVGGVFCLICRWNGAEWFKGHEFYEKAELINVPSECPNLPWRELTDADVTGDLFWGMA